MRIALCEDETDSRCALARMVRSFCEARELAAEIDAFSCGEDFLTSKREYDIVFVDIYLTGMTGVETVKRLRDASHCQIVFTTTSREHAIEAFGLNAAHYLVKPLTAQAVAQAMERCLARLGKGPGKSLSVKTAQGIIPVPMEQIKYIEVRDKLCTIHSTKKDLETYTSLDALFEQLDGSFLRAQRSFVVNMNFIESISADRVVLRDGVQIPLSRSNRGALKGQYQKFLFDLARRDSL